MIKTIIADDHPMVLKGLELMLSSTKKYKVVATATNGNELIAVTNKFKADLMLIDYRMPILNGLEAVEDLKKRSKAKLVLVTSFADEWLVERAKKIGAEGIVCKSADEQVILTQLDLIMSGEKIFPSNNDIYELLYEPLKKTYHLTDCETNTIKELNDGLGIKEIAAKHFISPETVKSHKKSAFGKLGIHKTTLLAKLLNRL